MKVNILFRYLLITPFILACSIAATAANLIVVNSNDSGAGSLRQAIQAANNNNQPDTITFDTAFFNTARTIILTGGELAIDSDEGNALTITGPGAALLTISGNNQSRVIYVGQDADLTLNGVRIISGNGTGGNTGVDGEGGGIFCAFAGALNLNSSIINGNRAEYYGGGIRTASQCRLNVRSSTISQNQAVQISGGGLQSGGPTVLTDTVITGNRAENDGGIGNNDVMTLTNVTVSENSANFGGGGISNLSLFGSITVNDSTINDNKTARGSGGGIYNALGSLTVSDSVVNHNSSSSDPFFLGAGGGIYNNDKATIINSTISNNTAAVAGGGGIFNNFTNSIIILNSTISGNRATGGGGISTVDDGATVTLLNVTVTNNTAVRGAGGGISTTGALGDGILYARNTIIAGNHVIDSAEFPDYSGELHSRGNNLIGNTQGVDIFGTTSGNLLNVNPQLLPLTNNGGRTLTHALSANSPAINAGNNCVLTASGCGTGDPEQALTSDQRGTGFPRQKGSTVDIGAVEYSGVSQTRRAPYDFDGDGKTDIGIFRSSDGNWWYSRSSDNGVRVYAFGNASDIMTPGDFTGDGKADIAIWCPSTGFWFVQRSEDSSFYSFPFGTNGDIPAPADYDGDGKTDAAVFRPSAGTWFILNSGGSGTTIVNFGTSQDKPVAADFDGDGKADIAIFRPGDGSWWYLQSSDLSSRVYRFGISTDKPVQGDYTGDGKADIAIFRPSTGEWFIQRSEDASFYSVPFGANGDVSAPGDYDGDGKFDTAVFRPATGNWFVNRSTAGILITTFGSNGDRPIPNAFVR